MSIFFRLVLGHIIGDFALQTVDLVVLKARSWRGLFLHALIMTACFVLAFWTDLPVWWPWLLPLFALHWLTDWGKVALARRFPQRKLSMFILDQVVHLAVIVGVIWLQEGRWPYASLAETVAGPGSTVAANRDLLFLLAFLLAFFVVPLLEAQVAGKWMRTFAGDIVLPNGYVASMSDRLWGGAERTLVLLLLYLGGLAVWFTPLAFVPRVLSLWSTWKQPEQALVYRIKIATSIGCTLILGGLLYLAEYLLRA